MLEEIRINAPEDSAHIRKALHDGFFLVRNPVPEILLDETYAALEEFFRRPTEEKVACGVPGSNGQSGYTPPLVETAEKATAPDWKELFHWGAALPHSHPLRTRFPDRYPEPFMPDHLVPGIGAALTALHQRMLHFQFDVVKAISYALHVHSDYFTDMLQDGPVVNRATWYPPMDQAPSPDHIWAVEHQDFDLITALPRATSAGLQVLKDGDWHNVDVPEGYAVVNVGMVLDRLTNGLARAAVHRVVAAPEQRGGRLSIVQFCHPAPWTVLTPLRIPGQENTPQRFSTLTAEDLFRRTMYRINRLDDQL